MSQITITTIHEADGTFSYQFTLNGHVYEDFDFRTRAAALEEARSVARVVTLNPEIIPFR